MSSPVYEKGNVVLQDPKSLQGYNNLGYQAHQELDLEVQKDVNDCFANERPGYAFPAAAKVGGIYANNTYPNGLQLTYQDFLKIHGQ